MTRLLWVAVVGLILPVVLSQATDEDDLCADFKCKKPRGSMCQVTEIDGVLKPSCVCPTSCVGEQDSPVCSVFGKQYANLCEFHKFSCKKRKSIPLAFEKPCIASQKACTKEEFSQFPYRLLEWFMHLKENDEFGRIDPNRRISYIDIAQREQVATWKFDALDTNEDDSLDKAELLRFRYALMPLEHCSSPFFVRCAKLHGEAKKISIQEWMECLKVYDVVGEEETPQEQTEGNPEEPVAEEEEEEEEDVEEEDTEAQ